MHVRTRDPMRLPMLAGWLFADLMLMLFLVGLSMAPATTETETKATPTPTLTSPSPTATPKGPRVVDPHPYPMQRVEVNLTALGGADSREADRLRNNIDAMLRRLKQDNPELRGREVGVALVFGAGPRNAIGIAHQRAEKVGAILRSTHSSFRDAVVEPLWTEGPPRFVKLRLYFYSN